MGLQVSYLVHNPHVASNAVRAMVKGKEVTASMDMLEVELVANDREHGSIKLRFGGDQLEAAKAAFPNDKMVTVTFGDPQDAPAAS